MENRLPHQLGATPTNTTISHKGCKMSDKQNTFNFEKSLEGLNKLVQKLEQGGLSLEESLKTFEEGISLTRRCQEALKSAEQKVQVLLSKQDGEQLETYQLEDNA